MYFPTGQAGGALSNMILLVRTDGDPIGLSKSVQSVIPRSTHRNLCIAWRR